MKIFTYLKFCLLITLISTTTSCFEIIEEVDLKSDGSGTMAYTLNMSKSKAKLASIMLLDSVNGFKVPSREDIQNGLDDIVVELKKAEGITNIKKTADYDNFVFSVKCDFKKIDNINKMTNEVWSKQKNKTPLSSYFFDSSKGSFKRQYSYTGDVKKQYNRLKAENKKVFDDASYTVIYRFDKEITSQNNQQAKVSKSKKAVMQRISAIDIINGKGDINNQIQLKK